MHAHETRTLGRTSIGTTLLSFGGSPIGNFLRPMDHEEARSLVDDAWALGTRTFDTAPLYGHGLSELRLGEALAGRPRDEYVVSSKAGRVLMPAAPGSFESGLWAEPAPFQATFDYTRDGVLRSVDQSLERLGIDRIDIVYMHDVDRYTHGETQPSAFRTAVDEGFGALAELRDQGVVGAIGFGVNEADVCAQAVRETDTDCVLLAGRYTLLEQEPLDDLLPLCEERGVGVVLGGVYNSGILATGPTDRSKFNYAPAPPEVRARVARIAEVCARHDVPLPAAALAFAAAHPAVASICIGSRTVAQQRETAALLGTVVPAELWAELREAGLLRDDAPTPESAGASR